MWCACACVCMRVCMCEGYTHRYIHAYICISQYVHIFISMFVRKFVYALLYIINEEKASTEEICRFLLPEQRNHMHIAILFDFTPFLCTRTLYVSLVRTSAVLLMAVHSESCFFLSFMYSNLADNTCCLAISTKPSSRSEIQCA